MLVVSSEMTVVESLPAGDVTKYVKFDKEQRDVFGSQGRRHLSLDHRHHPK